MSCCVYRTYKHVVMAFLSQDGAARQISGMSLIEMLVTILIMGIILAGTSEMVMINNSGIMTLFNKVDSLNAARQLIERLGKDIREARNVGDIYGEHQPYANPPPTYLDLAVDYFPAPQNPLYGAGQAPAGGWPQAPWPGQGSVGYKLSNSCLVVQTPVFDVNGFPTIINKGTGNPPAGTNLDNVDTLVYQVLADPNSPGEWMIQEATFLGQGSTRTRLNPPVTIMTGIIGPINPATNNPRVFQYLDRTDPTSSPQDTVLPSNVPNITGVIINLEVRRSASEVNRPESIGISSQVFMRNNTLSTTTGI